MIEKRSALYTYQYCFLMLMSCLGNLFLVEAVYDHVGNGAYMAFLLCIPVGLLIVLLHLLLFRRIKDHSLEEIYEYALGKWVGRIIEVCIALFFVVMVCLMMSYYSLHTSENLLGGQNVALFAIPIALVCAYAACRGVGTVGRMAVLAGSVMLAVSIVAAALQIFSGRADHLFPVLGTDAENLARMVFALSIIEFGGMLPVVFFLPQTGKSYQWKPSVISMFAGNLLIALFAVGELMVSGQSTAMGQVAYYSAPVLPVMDAVDALKVFVTAAYFFAAAFRITINACAAGRLLRHAFQAKKAKWLPLPICVAGLVVSLVLEGNSVQTTGFLLYIYPLIGLIPLMGFPLLAHLALWVKNAKRNRDKSRL